MSKEPAPDVQLVFAVVRDRLLAQHPQDTEGRMLRAPGMRAGDKFYAFVSAADVMMKLPADRVTELIEAGQGRPCSPRPGHPMREWVCVSPADPETCFALVTEARTFVVSQARARTRTSTQLGP